MTGGRDDNTGARDIRDTINRLWRGNHLWLALTLLIVFILRLPSSTTAQCNVDEGLYLTCAKDLMGGGIPYQTSWEQKGPLIFFLYMPVIWLFGNDIVPIRIFHNIYMASSMLFIYLIHQRIKSGKTSIIPCLAYGLFFLNQEFEGLCINGEPVMMLPLIIATFFFVRYLRGRGVGGLNLFLCGFLSASSVFVKPTALFTALVFPLALIVKGVFDRKHGNKRFMADAAAYGTGALLITSMVIIYLLAYGSLDDYIEAVYKVNSKYSQITPRIEALKLLAVFYYTALKTDTVTMAATISLVYLMVRLRNGGRQRDICYLILGITVFSLIGTNWGGNMFNHYFLQMGLGFSLAVGFAIDNITFKKHAMNNSINTFLIILLLNSNLAAAIWEFNDNLKTYQKSDLHRVAKYINKRTDPDDYLLILSDDAIIYFYADRRPATRYLAGMFHSNFRREVIQPEAITMSDLENNRPVYIVLRQPTWSYMKNFIKRNYYLEGRINGFVLIRIKEQYRR